MMKLDIKAMGLSLGIMWAASVLLMGVLAMTTGWGMPFVAGLGKLYTGYQPTIGGCIIGAIWGFIDMGIGGVVLAWLYNKFAK